MTFHLVTEFIERDNSTLSTHIDQ